MPADRSAAGASLSTTGRRRRDELLEVAAKLFAARGYHGTRMDDIAEAVGLNKATLYHYYTSKSLILYDICQSAADFAVDTLREALNANSARETLYHVTCRLLIGIANDPERAAVYFQESPYMTEWLTNDMADSIRRAETTVYNDLRRVINQGIAAREFYDCDADVLARAYIGTTLGSYRWIRPNSGRTAPEIAVEFSTALLRGLVRDESLRADSPLKLLATDSSDSPLGERQLPLQAGSFRHDAF